MGLYAEYMHDTTLEVTSFYVSQYELASFIIIFESWLKIKYHFLMFPSLYQS